MEVITRETSHFEDGELTVDLGLDESLDVYIDLEIDKSPRLKSPIYPVVHVEERYDRHFRSRMVSRMNAHIGVHNIVVCNERAGNSKSLKEDSVTSTWPDWGQPLPGEDIDAVLPAGDTKMACSSLPVKNQATKEAVKHHATKKAVTFSDYVTYVEPISLQEERETGSLSHSDCSDNDFEPGAQSVDDSSARREIVVYGSRRSSSSQEISPADKLAAYQLLNISKMLEHREDQDREVAVGVTVASFPEMAASCSENVATVSPTLRFGQNAAAVSWILGLGDDIKDPIDNLEELDVLMERMYAYFPLFNCAPGTDDCEFGEHEWTRDDDAADTWRIQVSKDAGKFRLDKIKRGREVLCSLTGGVGAMEEDSDDTEALGRPSSKRTFKSLRALLR